jgi:hypothetical protein
VSLLESLIGNVTRHQMHLPDALAVQIKFAKLEILTTAKSPFGSSPGKGESTRYLFFTNSIPRSDDAFGFTNFSLSAMSS